MSYVSVLVFDGQVLKKDFCAMLTELEPQVGSAQPGQLQSLKFPFLRHLVRLVSVAGDDAGAASVPAFETYDAFLARGRDISIALVEARAATVTPTDPGGLFFSSGTTSLPKGRSEEHTSELQSLMRISYAVFC